MRARLMVAAAALVSACAGGSANAEVIRFETLSVVKPALGGRTFGERGTAEKVTARATIAVDPSDPRNAVIADIGLAPRDAAGRVEAVADVVVLRPAKPNGLMLVEIPNRGRKLVGPLIEDSPTDTFARMEQPDDAGRGFMLSRGYTIVWVGWQGDIAPGAGMRIDVPVVPGITGPSREEWVFDNTKSPIEAKLTYPAANTDLASAHLTVRVRPDDPRTTPSDLSFRFIDPFRIEITRPASGFDASALYELTYVAKDPKMMGLGLAAIRDVATWLRRDTSAANPIAADGRTGIDRVIGFGISQSGRVLRDVLYWGFNQDEKGRMVFDGMVPHIAGSRRSFTNARFAQPGRNPAPHMDRYYPADQFPFSYGVSTDPLSGRRDGLLLRCHLSNTCPVILQVDSEYEMWGSRGALLTTDPSGNHLDLPGEVRAYMVTGSPHFSAPDAVTHAEPGCELPVSPVHAGPVARAIFAAIEAWTTDGVEPPASRYPMRAAGTLGSPDHLYPAIPGLPYRGLFNPAEWVEQADPVPVVRGTYPLLLPRVDGDGNTLGGVRMPLIEAPRATYTAWNPTKGSAAATLCNQQGGVLPFAATKAERIAHGDPRLSLEERYPTADSYVAAVKLAADRLVSERLLLQDDADRMVADAAAGRLAK